MASITFTGRRRAIYGNLNLLVDIPKVSGFSSLTPRETDDVLNLIYLSTNLPAGLVDFLGAAQISDDRKLFVWHARILRGEARLT